MTPYAHRVPQWGWLLALALLTTCPGVAQRINFGAYATSRGLSLVTSGDLDFNAKQPMIASGSNATVTVALTDGECQWIEITGDVARDITIAITADPYLTVGAGGPGNQIPFACKFAYSNLGSSTVSAAKSVAVQVPVGFNSITLPMLRRTSGAPAPPPTPAHGGYTAPSAKAYLFIYGALGPVGIVSAGTYSGTINVIVDY